MEAVEYFEVESTEETGGNYYRRIADVVLLDHNLLRVIRKLHIFIDPGVPIFVAVGVTRKLPGIVRIRDFADVAVTKQKVTISIGDETYLAPLLQILWKRYGKENVSQPDRFTIVLPIGESDAEIEDIPVVDPSESMYKDLIYALMVIQPEGFKVRRQWYGDGKFYLVASEDTLPEDIEDLVRAKFAMMGEHL
ncbi:MAG TPA: methanogenesis marker 17 protein [Methanoregulaceae archaeon]|nr:MAG: methanogenesis marker 17 protein [Methanolinea sp.]HON80678.1 methanogenesis marker 17 protein [Methanoregulaceae archaeon]HPD09412.1 methanogenesis marker 17 protein [Methanoregulaceae archaeon]HRT14795.1 methanogenesis marker 17 protein [Methanoregulaceae archaeon]HRU30368.1 methanogenesis marker 17 protein [Methanoregulaceae archaeon]